MWYRPGAKPSSATQPPVTLDWLIILSVPQFPQEVTAYFIGLLWRLKENISKIPSRALALS